MSFLKLSKVICSKKFNITCPYCEEHYFWTRISKMSFEHIGALTVLCHNCGRMYWVIRRRDKYGFYIRTNRAQEGQNRYT